MLDYIVARTVQTALLLEKACHGTGVWEIALGDSVEPAERILSDEAIVFRAKFPARCWVSTPNQTAELLCDGVSLRARPVVVPDDEVTFDIEWTFDLREPIVASIR